MLDNSEPKIYLGVDWGSRRIGVAIASSETKLAVPLQTVANVSELVALSLSEEADFIVLGQPFKMASRELELNPEFAKFLEELRKRLQIPVLLYDERLSSLAADALPGDKKDKVGRDEIAAMIILQNYLDSSGA